MVKRKAGRPLSEYETKITGPTGYLWREGRGPDGDGNGVFITVPLNPTTLADWNAQRPSRNAVHAARRQEDSSLGT
jgi:hypothetical protein